MSLALFSFLFVGFGFQSAFGFIDYYDHIKRGSFPDYLPSSPDLWVKPYLSEKEFQSHSFFGSFPHSPLISNCTENFFTQVIDHFNWRPALNAQTTYQERYFICSGANWKPNNTIFFYTGNEANVELYVNHTGLMWENADDFGAILIFAEHRYFGKSIMFDSNAMDNNHSYIYYANADQAMADYAVLITALKAQWDSADSPVIGFGGSYGGMLCAWFRMKYPAMMDGCIAASAPIAAFLGLNPPLITNYLARIETYDCTINGHLNNDHCATNYQQTWSVIESFASTAAGRQNLQSTLRLCAVPKTYSDAMSLRGWVGNAVFMMAEGSYPYASSYMLNGQGFLPPYPLKIGCNNYLNRTFSSAAEDSLALLVAVRQSVDPYYNYTGTVQCYNAGLDTDSDSDSDSTAVSADDNGGVSWGYFVCTEIFMPHSTDGVTDMFWPNPFDLNATMESCFARYGTWPQPYWAAVNFGGYHIGSAGISNIVFSNGELDPWRGGGIQTNLSDSLPSIKIMDSGHHIDLYFSNPNDTASITDARAFELNQMRAWIAQKRDNQKELQRRLKNDL